MPGRRHAGRPQQTQQTKPRRSQRKQHKRAQNALAIAEAEDDGRESSGFRKHRFGHVEEDFRKRQRGGDDEEADSDDDFESQRKRPRTTLRERYGEDAEYGSDSEGNEWVTGQINDEDDESIDSDEAFGESDDELADRFPSAFKGKKNRGHQSDKRHQSKSLLDDASEDESANEMDSEAESENFAENAVDLHTMLDDNDDSDDDDGGEEASGATGGVNSQKRGSVGDMGTGLHSDFEEDDDDDTSRTGDQASELSFDSEEDDAMVSEARSRALLDMVSGLGTGDETAQRERKKREQGREALEPTGIITQDAGLEDLLDGLDPETRKLMGVAIKPSKKSGNGIPGKVDVPLPQRQQGRLDRAAAYEKSKETLARWIETVKQNRRAEHLSFPLLNRDELSARNVDRLKPLNDSKPFNELEAMIQKIMAENGMANEQSAQQEDDEELQLESAPTKEPTLAEVLAQRAELRKMRDVIFREEIKARRIKKIKSKSYRRVHRKARERELEKQQLLDAEEGTLPVEDDQDRLDRLRAEERMGAKHKESKWAKAMKATGRTAWDEDARNGMIDMARREEELKKRIHGNALDDDVSSLDDGESEVDEDQLHDDLSRLREQEENSGRGGKLANLAFMKRAEEAQRQQNEATIAQIRRDLDGDASSDSDEDGAGRRKFGPKKELNLGTKPTQVEKSEFEEDEGSVNGEFDDEDDSIQVFSNDKGPEATKPERQTVSSRPSQNQQGVSNGQRTKHMAESNAKDDDWTELLSSNANNNGTEPEHDWMETLTSEAKKNRSKRPKEAAALTEVTIDPSKVQEKQPVSDEHKENSQSSRAASKQVRLLPADDNDDEATSSSGSDSDSDPDSEPTTWLSRQRSALQRAFAGDEVVASFEADKAGVANEERSPSPTADVLPGWGSWTGSGLSKRDRRDVQRQKARAQEQARALALPARSKKKGRQQQQQQQLQQQQQQQQQQGMRWMAAKKGAGNRLANKIDATRRDAGLANVIISEKNDKKSTYLASSLPHRFESRAQYERSLRVPLGPEWTTRQTHGAATKPRLLLSGGAIKPMERPLI